MDKVTENEKLKEEIRSLKSERDDAVQIIRQLLECRRTCPTIGRFAISVKEILKDAGRWEKRR